MKANEFRIGNLILLTKDNFKTSKVYEVDSFDIYKLDESDCFDGAPIPLTEEWLVKFGFDKNRGTYDRGNYFLIEQAGKWRFGVDEEGGLTLCNIDFVHQLQNLFFALTGKELIYNETV